MRGGKEGEESERVSEGVMEGGKERKESRVSE